MELMFKNLLNLLKVILKGNHIIQTSPLLCICKMLLLVKNIRNSKLTARLRNGSLQLLGKVGEVDPPNLVMPLTIEPSKPRLCHDERFLNLWIRDCPFSLETLRDVP